MSRPPTTRADGSAFPVLLLVAVGSWLLVPLLVRDVVPQDAVPLLVAGELAPDRPDLVYLDDPSSLYDLSHEVRERTCEFYEDVDRCIDEGVAFISPPVALPLLVGLAGLDDPAGRVVLQYLAVGALAAGFSFLVRPLVDRDEAALPLVATAVLLLIEVQRQIELGQTSALLFLLAAVPVARPGRRRWSALTVVALVLAVAMKAFPAVLLVALLAVGRVGIAVGAALALSALAVATGALGPFSWWGDFLALSGEVADISADNPFNLAPPAVATSLGLPAAVGTALGAGAAVAGLGFLLRRGDDRQLWWSSALVLTLLVLPQVWNHYLVVALALLGHAAVGRCRRPELWLLAGTAVLTGYRTLFTDGGTASQVVGLGVLAAAIGSSGFLVARSPGPAGTLTGDDVEHRYV